MSWSSAERSSWSLARRLTALHALSTLAVLVTTGGFLYAALRENVRREDVAFLTTRVRVLQRLFSAPRIDHEALTDLVVREPGAGGSVRYFIRVLDASGRPTLATVGMDPILPERAFPEGSGTLRIRERRLPAGTYLLAVAPVAGLATGSVQVALDTSPEAELLSEFRGATVAAIVFGVLLSVLSGAWTAHRGLRPLDRIARRAERITASRLEERIGTEPWPHELAVLASVLDSMLDRLADAITRLSRFSADLAHELRTPIHNLRGEAEVALSRPRDAEEYRRVLESNLEECERIARMVDALLFLAKAETRRVASEMRTVDASAELQTLCEFHSPIAEDRGVVLRAIGGGVVQVEPVLFRRALSNLLSNALRHTRAGGTVQISAEHDPAQGFRIRVTDTGCGIPAEHLPFVFDRLYRVDSSRTEAGDGAGLGLSIVRSIMDLHGGTASIESEPGRGTTVSLLFPSTPPPSPKITGL